jgi:hypothetical protein
MRIKKENYFDELLEVKYQSAAVTITIWERIHPHLKVDNQIKYEINKLRVEINFE